MSSHILIVEDDAFIATIFEKILARMGGYAVTVTDDVERALALVRKRQIQLVIMDVALSRSTYQAEAIDGVALTRLMKSDAGADTLPVLLVTAHAMPGDAERLLAASGANDYLSKPLPHPALLIERVKALLGETAPAGAPRRSS
jgi:CheY-like chemotaxis protein